MAFRRTGTEALYTVTAAVAIAAAFRGAAYAYPPGRETIWNIGIVTIAAVVGMAWPQLRDAWRADRADRT
jgi:quinol-cytochrome oxidoreductase complex cytochrome b subunit